MSSKEVIVLGGGCFWCTEAVFSMLKGIIKVMPGYAGGTTEHPTYDHVVSGRTGHAEVIEVVYDSKIISLENILTVFFASHDPTIRNRQGNDVGEQYRSLILYTTLEQKTVIQNFITSINTSSKEGASIVTEVAPLTAFFPAESYHVDYYARNKENPYCEVVINPKLEKVQRKFSELLKTNTP